MTCEQSKPPVMHPIQQLHNGNKYNIYQTLGKYLL